MWKRLPPRAERAGPTASSAARATVQWISGCAILVRGDVIRVVGALDERFFYLLGRDRVVRPRGAGRVAHRARAAAKVWHKGVQRDYRPEPAVTYYATRNRLLLLPTHHAPSPRGLGVGPDPADARQLDRQAEVAAHARPSRRDAGRRRSTSCTPGGDRCSSENAWRTNSLRVHRGHPTCGQAA